MAVQMPHTTKPNKLSVPFLPLAHTQRRSHASLRNHRNPHNNITPLGVNNLERKLDPSLAPKLTSHQYLGPGATVSNVHDLPVLQDELAGVLRIGV